MSFFSDDDVIVYSDPQGLCDFHNDSRHFNIGARGRRITRGMIVHQDHACDLDGVVAAQHRRQASAPGKMKGVPLVIQCAWLCAMRFEPKRSKA